MRRIVVWLASTVTVVVLLFSYPASTNRGTSAGTTVTAATGIATTGTAYTGSVASTRWGPVQVKITVADHRVTAVTIIQQPDGNRRDQEINQEAIPILITETLEAQSAKIDMVSGATVTSDGYVESLQAALDQAGI